MLPQYFLDRLHSRKTTELRRIMRGYRILKDTGELGRIGEVKECLTNTPLNMSAGYAGRLIFGAGSASSELVLRQYLITLVAGKNLNKVLLRSIGAGDVPIIHPLPPEWRSVLSEKGFRIAGLKTALTWYGFLFLLLANGTVTVGKILFDGLKERVRKTFPKIGRYVYFIGIAPGNLPSTVEDGISHDIVTWYQRWDGRERNIDSLCHSVSGSASGSVKDTPVIRIPSEFPPITNCSALFKFLTWGLLSFIVVVAALISGRWMYAFILRQAAVAAQVRYLDPNKLAADYLFHNSSWIYRPLWTYEAEKKGSRITCYFYSTNIEPFGEQGRTPNYMNSWQITNWPHYLVWDKYQEEFIKSHVDERSVVSIVGPIWFQDSGKRVKNLPNGTVALFDVQPVRNSVYQTLGLELEYYVPSTNEKFLSDVYEAIETANLHGAFKRKRKIEKMAHPYYRRFLKQLESRQSYVPVDPEISALSLIEKCLGVISMPFTSTALLASDCGKPSVYYDPLNILGYDSRQTHGIRVITDKEKLTKWLVSIS